MWIAPVEIRAGKWWGAYMERAEFEALCLACADDLESMYGESLREHVLAALEGDTQSGQSRHMNVWALVGGITEISNLLVGMLGVGVAYVTLRRTPQITSERDDRDAGEIELSADVDAFEAAVDAETADFDDEQRAVVDKLKSEVCEWLRERSQR